MQHMIEDLWNGRIAPCEDCGAHDPEICDLLDLMARNKKDLMSGCSAQQQESLEKYIDCVDEYLLRMMERAFCSGFSVASRMLAEALAGEG